MMLFAAPVVSALAAYRGSLRAEIAPVRADASLARHDDHGDA
jgi:hypothetical protein